TPLLDYTDFAEFETRDEMINAEHKVNHIMLNPSSNRFMVLHRWISGSKRYTRLVTMNIDGSDMYNLSDDDMTSHCSWKNDEEISFYIMKSNKMKIIAKVFAPFKYDNDVRCDLHPRWNKKGNKICIDSVLNGKRNLYIIDEV